MDSMAGRLRGFFLPRCSRHLLVRLLLVALGAALVFSQILIPLRIQGRSMEPTIRDGEFALCWRGRYAFSEPRRGDVVALRLAGQRVMLLKRVVALAGDTVEFRHGRLLVNGAEMPEPYVVQRVDWNLEPRQVEQGKVYVAGDNRGVAMERHAFGQVERRRIAGGVIW